MLTWTVNKEGSVFTDGLLINQTKWRETLQTSLPCSTSLVAFAVNNTGDKTGLLASLDNTWATGDPGLKCTDNVSLAYANDWKYYSMWQFFIILLSIALISWPSWLPWTTVGPRGIPGWIVLKLSLLWMIPMTGNITLCGLFSLKYHQYLLPPHFLNFGRYCFCRYLFFYVCKHAISITA